ncbi:hypothetical protein B0H11DRAFT_2227047 [Mycena galericulata]|nr:hypothetical protein B0H11DRAFT_2227047 [Mycena galericulata]
MDLYPHLDITAEFLQKYPRFSDYEHLTYKNSQWFYAQPFKPRPRMPTVPSDDAFRTAGDNLLSAIDDYLSIAETASNSAFRSKQLSSLVNTAVRWSAAYFSLFFLLIFDPAEAVLYPFKEGLHTWKDAKEGVFKVKRLVKDFVAANPLYRAPEAAYQEVLLTSQYYEVQREAHKAHKEAEKEKKEKEDKAKKGKGKSTKKNAKTPIIVPDSEDEKSDDDKKIVWVLRKLMGMQMDVDQPAGPILDGGSQVAIQFGSIPSTLHFTKTKLAAPAEIISTPANTGGRLSFPGPANRPDLVVIFDIPRLNPYYIWSGQMVGIF